MLYQLEHPTQDHAYYKREQESSIAPHDFVILL